MASEIVNRLRKYRPNDEWGLPGRHTICDEAADRIEALERKVAELEAALKPFNTGWADENGWTDTACQHDRIVDWFGPSDFRAVAAVLSHAKAPDPKPFVFADPAAQREWERQRKERGQ